MANTVYTYSDVSRKMEIDASGNVKILYDNDVIIQSLNMLFGAMQGEYVRSLRGSRLIRLLGREFSDTTTTLIRQEVERCVNEYEPRVQVLQVLIQPYPDDNYYDVLCNLVITATRQNIVYSTRIRSLLF